MPASKPIAAKIGIKMLIAIPSNCERNPNPKAEAIPPSAGKQAVQLKAANSTPLDPNFSISFDNV